MKNQPNFVSYHKYYSKDYSDEIDDYDNSNSGYVDYYHEVANTGDLFTKDISWEDYES